MANVLFKRGLEANLPASGSAVDGALYFTTDTKRLFLGNGTALLPIAEGITTVESVSSLPTASEHKGQFYYITGDNILAWSNGTTWLQTNKNTTLTATTTALSTANDGTVSLSIQDSDGHQATGSFQITNGTDNVAIGRDSSTGALTISVTAPNTEYTLGTAANGDNVNITLTPNSGTAQSITLADSTSVNVALDNGAIKFNVNDSAIDAISSVDLGTGDGAATNPSTNGFNIDITTSKGTHKQDSIDPIIAYGNSGNQEAHFTNGTATLSVYTKTEIDDKIEDLEKSMDAMTYRGVATTAADIPGAEGAHLGDTWKADGSFTIDGKQVKPGYLIIAQGTEGTDGTIAEPTYDVVSGSVTDTTYQLEAMTNGIRLKNSNNTYNGDLKIVGTANDISATDVANSSYTKEIQLDLVDVTRTNSTGEAISQAAGATAAITAVTGVTTDAKGRVTGVETTSFTARDTRLSENGVTNAVSAANNVATISTTVADESGRQPSDSYTLGSTGSLAVSASGKAVTVDLVWGNF